MGRKRHNTNPRQRRLITLGCALLLFSIVGVYRDSLSVDAATVSSPNTTATTSPSPVQKRSTDVKRPNPVRRFFSRIAEGVTRVFRRPDPIACSLPPAVSIMSSTSSVTFCPTTPNPSNLTCSPSRDVSLTANVGAPDDVEFLFTWNVTGGRIKGEGRNVTWDMSEVTEGTYKASVDVKDVHRHTTYASTTVRVGLCPGCEAPVPRCPDVSVSCPDEVRPNQPITFQANVSARDSEMKPTYTWSVTAGRIISGQGTPKVTLDISGLGRQSITATVSIGGVDPSCIGYTASCTIVDY